MPGLENMNVIVTTVPLIKGNHSILLTELFGILEESGCKPLLWNAYHIPDSPYIKLPEIALPEIKKTQLVGISLKWLKRYMTWKRCGYKEAFKWCVKTKLLALAILRDVRPAHFFCWNRSCCAFGYLAEILEKHGVNVLSIEWGSLPGSFLITNRDRNFPTWNMPRDDDEKSTHFIVRNITASGSGIYAQESKMHVHYQHLLNEKSKHRILYLGMSEVDSFCIPPSHIERRRYLPFSKSCLHLFEQITSLAPNACCVYKPHPLQSDCKPGRLAENSHIVDGNPEEWIHWADTIISNGSKLEVDVIHQGKNLICVGGGLFWGHDFAQNVSTFNGLADCINRSDPNEISSDMVNPSLLSALTKIANEELIIKGEFEHNSKVISKLIKEA